MTPAYKLVAVDLDGTLFNDQRKIPEENIRAIRAAVAQAPGVAAGAMRAVANAAAAAAQAAATGAARAGAAADAVEASAHDSE